jgi:hypothetical protein
MLNFEYQIKLNDEGRPYIDIPQSYEDKPEDKFMALELARYVINNLLLIRGSELPPNEVKALESTFATLEVLSDELAVLLRQQMEVLGEVEINMYRNYHITVDTKKDRDKLNYEGIMHKGRIFKRMMGLKVLVLEDMNVYELVDGIDNEHWTKI